jgi:hypothetical protein
VSEDVFQNYADEHGISRLQAKSILFLQRYGGAPTTNVGNLFPNPTPIVSVEPDGDGVYKITTMEG